LSLCVLSITLGRREKIVHFSRADFLRLDSLIFSDESNDFLTTGCNVCDLDTIMDSDDELCWDCEEGTRFKDGYQATEVKITFSHIGG
jgi:hypothetical protein